MKRLLAAIVGLCLIATAAAAFYQSRDSNYNQNVVSGGGGGFTGILDVAGIPTPVMAFSASHCPKSSYTGNLVDVFSNSNSAVMATLNCSSGGVLGATGTWTLAQVKSNCTATHDCFAFKFYDISGALACTGGTACNTGTLTTATAPWLVLADGTTSCGSGSTFANANTFCLQTNTPGLVTIVSGAITSAVAQPVSYLVTYATLSTGGQGFLMNNSTTSAAALTDPSSVVSTFGSFAGGTVLSTPAAEAQWHTGLITLNGASSYLQIDNLTPNTSNPGTGSLAASDTITIGSNAGGSGFFGFIEDLYVFKTTSLSASASSIYTVTKGYTGGGMP